MTMETNPWRQLVPGIPDKYFERGPVPMTKEEVRAVTLAKAKIRPEAVVYDLGSGTGSLAVEAALLAWRGRVFAVERRPEAVELIKLNRRRFDLENLTVIQGEAPAALEELPPADAILVGGSGGRLREILQVSLEHLRPGGKLVINAVTLETLAAGVDWARERNLTFEAVGLAVTRLEATGRSSLWRAQNPVQIITFDRPAQNQPGEEEK